MKNKSLLLKLLTCLCPMALAFFCLVGYKYQQSHKNFLPEDLMYNGSPIHPSCVVSTLFDDSSRSEPQSITYTTAHLLQEHGYKVHSDECVSDPTTKTVTARCEYSFCDPDRLQEEYQSPKCSQEQYQYVGSYKNKHIVITRHHDSSGTGRFSDLGLITRNSDTICNAGAIAGGDRAHGGVIKVVFFEDNILRFQQIATPACLNNIISCDDTDLPDSPHSQGAWFVYEVNLDDPKLETTFSGISFFDDSDAYKDCYAANDADACFCILARESLDAGKQSLNVAESKYFAKNVVEAIAAMQGSKEDKTS